MVNGWWRLETTRIDVSELTEVDREHIAKLIQEGYIEGEIIKNDS